MRSLLFFNYRFTCKAWVAILSCFAIACFVGLGRWQLHRAQEKQTIINNQANFAAQKAIFWTTDLSQPASFQKLQLSGTFTKETFLLDNQSHHHAQGYHVLTPLLIDTKNAILIDRGWIPTGPSRKILPKLKTMPTLPLQIQGYVYYPNINPLIFGPDIDYKSGHLTRIERVNLEFLSNLLHIRLYPFIIRLDKVSPHGYLREWSVVSLPPERHYGYAIQWFAMAIMVGILFIGLNLKKHESHCEQ